MVEDLCKTYRTSNIFTLWIYELIRWQCKLWSNVDSVQQRVRYHIGKTTRGLSLFNCMEIPSFHGPPTFMIEQKDSYLRVKLLSWAELAMRM